jgi:hypothetical protein
MSSFILSAFCLLSISWRARLCGPIGGCIGGCIGVCARGGKECMAGRVSEQCTNEERMNEECMNG